MTPSIPRTAAGPQDLSRAEAVGDLYRRHAVGLVRLALLLVGDQPSADNAYVKLVAAGFPVLRPPHDTGNNNRNALLSDPDGNLVEIVAKTA